jgi:hypothetical protein
MAYEVPGFKLGTLEAPSTAFSVAQYRAVTASSSHPYIKYPSSNGAMLGFCQNAPSVAGESVEIMVDGVSKARAEQALGAGDNYIIGTNGMIASTSAAAAEAVIYGPVLVAAGGSSQIATVSLRTVGMTT